ncbi:hypothetical protein HDU91_000474 [Kappamyces sp. JEL0680]|nr:hypothetical protein HDU91_000474 [Kappamyces sp. JEL0680]
MPWPMAVELILVSKRLRLPAGSKGNGGTDDGCLTDMNTPIYLLIGIALAQSCTTPTVRPEWRQLSEMQKQSYLTAVRLLKNRTASAPTALDMSIWNHDQFTKAHWDYAANNHGKAAFFPWHRRFLAGYEQALQSVVPGVVLPYWDWRLDSQNPGASDLWASKYFGGNGDPLNKNCVTSGVAAGWVSQNGPNAGSCLKRCSVWGALYSPEAIASLMNAGVDYSSFWGMIEGGPHATVHNQMVWCAFE